LNGIQKDENVVIGLPVAEVPVAKSMPLEPAWVDRTAVAAAAAVAGDSMDALVPFADSQRRFSTSSSRDTVPLLAYYYTVVVFVVR
jgi:hypothetical protein